MHVSSEPNFDLLRKKARLLEVENTRLSKKVTELLRENLALKGMSAEQVELNLAALCSKISGKGPKDSGPATRPGSERRSDEPKKEKEKEKKPQTGHGPTAQLDLPVVNEVIELDEADRTCPGCGDRLEDWDGHEDEPEEIDVVERYWVIRKTKLKKARCRCGHIETAERPPRLVKGGRYSPGVAKVTAVAKYLDHIPLERQVRMAKRQGVQLTNQTLWDQILALSILLTPVTLRIKDFILSHLVIGADESPFKLIKKGGSLKWQAWEISCALGIYFEILPAKSAEMGKRLLGTFKGTLMVDGAPSYKALANAAMFTIANCWSHVRRKVLEAEGEAPAQVKEFLDLVGALYAIDRKAARAPPDEKCAPGGYRRQIDKEKLRVLRDTESRAVVKKIHDWILAQKCMPGGELKKKLEYVAKRWTALTLFLDNPEIPLDNNRTEGGYIGMAIGRRNYIGARSARGTEVAAVFYTLFESTKLCGGDPAAYLDYATDKALSGEPPLLPHEWVAQN